MGEVIEIFQQQTKTVRWKENEQPISLTYLLSGYLCQFSAVFHVSSEKNPGCLGYIEDYATQFYGDFN